MRKKYNVPLHIKTMIKKDLYNYEYDKKTLKDLEDEIIFQSGSPDGQPKGNKLIKTTENKALKLSCSRDILIVRKRITHIENALDRLDDGEKDIVESIFFKGHNQAYCETHEYITRDVYYHILNKMVYLTAKEYDLI